MILAARVVFRESSSMRIIAGEFRGRSIAAPRTDATRPITDRVKQSLFDILAPRIEGAIVYDVFCGSGSMGLESLSRGAGAASFFDAGREAIRALHANIGSLGVADRSTVIQSDVFAWFHAHPAPAVAADLVFLDPPYRFARERATELQRLTERLIAHLAPDGVIIYRHDTGDALTLGTLARYDQRMYGSMTLEFLVPAPR